MRGHALREPTREHMQTRGGTKNRGNTKKWTLDRRPGWNTASEQGGARCIKCLVLDERGRQAQPKK